MGIQELVREVMAEAEAVAGSQKELIGWIRDLTGRTYKESAVTAWTHGRSSPPAFALLAAVKATQGSAKQISLDERLFGESLKSRLEQVESELAELRRLVETRPLLAGDGSLEAPGRP